MLVQKSHVDMADSFDSTVESFAGNWMDFVAAVGLIAVAGEMVSISLLFPFVLRGCMGH